MKVVNLRMKNLLRKKKGSTTYCFPSLSLLVTYNPQFYIQLVFKAPLCITLTISDQKIVSGSLFFQFFSTFSKKIIKNWKDIEKKIGNKIFGSKIGYHDFLVGNRECNTERDFKNQLYIELGCIHFDPN